MRFQEMTSPNLARVDREKVIAVIPVAAVEQHGPHMPTGTDNLICTAIAEAVESRDPDRILLTPTVWLGASAHHLRLGATLDTQLATYTDTLCDIGRSLLNDGFRRIAFLNGHGGNVDPMRMAVRILQTRYTNCLLVAGSYWTTMAAAMQSTMSGEDRVVGHACELETSLMLHLRPELVDRDRVTAAGTLVKDGVNGFLISRDLRQRTPAGFTGRPDLATAEKGSVLFEAAVAGVLDTFDRLHNERLGTEYAELID